MSSEAGPEVLKIANSYARFISGGLSVLPLLLLVTGAGSARWHEAPDLYAALAVVALILLLYPFWRMGVRFDDHGVRIRGFLRTDRFGWPEVSQFADGRLTLSDGKGASEDVWALAVVLHDGRAITVKATSAWLKWPTSRGPKMRAAIAQVAARYQIPAELTGVMPQPASVKRQPSESALGRELDDAILARARKFSTVRLRPGYDQEEVDAFLDAIRDTFLGVREPFLTSDEVSDKRFLATRLHSGYDQEEVDAFLDEIELRLAALPRYRRDFKRDDLW